MTFASTIAARIEELNARHVGHQVHYIGEKGKRKLDVEGVITEIEFAGCSITNARGEWLGIRFRIKPKGRRPVWTWAMADEWTGAPCDA